MEAGIIAALISAAASIAVAIIGGVMVRENRKTQQRAEWAQQLDIKRDGILSALVEAERLNLKRLHGEQLNGEVEAALTALDSAERQYSELRTEIIAKAV